MTDSKDNHSSLSDEDIASLEEAVNNAIENIIVALDLGKTYLPSETFIKALKVLVEELENSEADEQEQPATEEVVNNLSDESVSSTVH